MFIEALARLTLLNEACKENGVTLVSQDFMQETEDVIQSQIKILQRDIQFQTENPGPYVFGLGKFSVNIFPPIFTDTGEWVMIILNEETQNKERLFVFHSLLGLIENLGHAFKFIESRNAGTSTEDRESQAEA